MELFEMINEAHSINKVMTNQVNILGEELKNKVGEINRLHKYTRDILMMLRTWKNIYKSMKQRIRMKLLT